MILEVKIAVLFLETKCTVREWDKLYDFRDLEIVQLLFLA